MKTYSIYRYADEDSNVYIFYILNSILDSIQELNEITSPNWGCFSSDEISEAIVDIIMKYSGLENADIDIYKLNDPWDPALGRLKLFIKAEIEDCTDNSE